MPQKWPKNLKTKNIWVCISEFFDVEQPFQRYLPAFFSDSHLRRERTPNFDIDEIWSDGPGHKKIHNGAGPGSRNGETAVFAFYPKSPNGKYLWIGRSTSKIAYAENRPLFSIFVIVNSSPCHGTWFNSPRKWVFQKSVFLKKKHWRTWT